MPQRRGLVPSELVDRLIAAGEALAAAHEERDAAVVAALRAGASTREVAALVGISGPAVMHIGRAAGWPSEAEQERRRRMNTVEHRFDHLYPDRWKAAEAERVRIAKEHERESRRKG